MRKVNAPDLNLAKLLKGFTAGFAKWRYETIAHCIECLGDLRVLCERFLTRDLFGEVQDAELLQDVLVACRMEAFWKWVACAYKFVYNPLEKLRRWALLCPCHEADRRAGIKVKHCPWNSRRLRQAYVQICAVAASFRNTANTLLLADCEGDETLYGWMIAACRRAAADVLVRFKYLGSIPWAFSNADTQTGAATVIDQYRARPPEDHDEFSNHFMESFESDVEAVRAGEPASRRLAVAVWKINTSSLDESAGEGYHRSTHHVLQRGPSSSTPYIKQSLRLAENLKQAKRVLTRFKNKGRQLIRYEWRNYKRVLRVESSRKWMPVKMMDRQFFRRLYRMDEMACEDWTPLVSRPGCVVVPQRDALEDSQEMALEYLSAALRPLTYYSFPRTTETQAQDGSLLQKRETQFCQVVKIHSRGSRPRILPNVQAFEDKSVVAKLALYVQPLSLWRADAETTGPMHVHADCDPMWVEPFDLAPFRDLSTQLMKWASARPSEHAGCQALVDVAPATPQCALTDADCPTILVLGKLKRDGWHQNPLGRTVHDETNVDCMLCDCRGAPSRKLYLQCLLDVRRRLRLTSSIPSDEKQSFYKCLLSEKKVEPGRSDQFYKATLKDVEPDCLPIADAAATTGQ